LDLLHDEDCQYSQLKIRIREQTMSIISLEIADLGNNVAIYLSETEETSLLNIELSCHF